MNKGYRIISIEANKLCKNNEDLVIDFLDAKCRDKYFTNYFDWSLDSEKIYKVCLKKFTKEERKQIFYRDTNDIKYSLALVQIEFNSCLKGDLTSSKKTAELRQYIYTNGFNINNKHYVRYKRSSGSSRLGNCLFILEDLYKPMSDWSNCKLEFDCYNEKHDLASWEAYRSLSLSSIIGLIDIPVSGILFLRDKKVKFNKNAIEVKKEGDILVVGEGETSVENNIWDGESLLDESIFIKGSKDVDITSKSMMLLRNRFFKTCAFRTKLQKFFKDKGIKDLETLKAKSGGFTTAKRIEDVVMVVTESSLKYNKFYKNGFSEECIKAWCHEMDGSQFGIVKYDKRTRFMDGDLVQTSYQLLNTIDFSYDDANILLQPTIDYITKVRQDPYVLAYHISKMSEGEFVDIKSHENEHNIETRDDILFRLLSINKDIKKTNIYYDFRNELVKQLKNTILEGKFLIPGTNATLFGNGPELLKACVGEFNNESVLKEDEISCIKFRDGEILVGARSPHITMGNLLYSKNVLNYELSEYFVLSPNIVCVNAINENIQYRLNGCDYDSDIMLLTNESLIVEKVKNHYLDFKVPVYNPNGKPLKKDLTLYELDHIISNNQIGTIVNLSQILNSLYWDIEDSSKRKELYMDICKLAVLSGLEIDRAKRDSGLNSDKIMGEIRRKYNSDLAKYPNFTKNIQQDHKKKKQRDCREFNCPMEYVSKIASNIDFRKGKKKYCEKCGIKSLFGDFKGHTVYDKEKVNTLLPIVETINNSLSAKYAKLGTEELSKSCKKILLEDIKNYKMKLKDEFIKRWKTEGFNKLMLEELDKADSPAKGLIFDMLFQKENEKLYQLIQLNVDEVEIVRDISGDILLYYNLFKKVEKNNKF